MVAYEPAGLSGNTWYRILNTVLLMALWAFMFGVVRPPSINNHKDCVQTIPEHGGYQDHLRRIVLRVTGSPDDLTSTVVVLNAQPRSIPDVRPRGGGGGGDGT